MPIRRTALAVLAHTDDESLGCGGTLARLAAEGWMVQVVILTDGLVTARGGKVQDNRANCDAACQRLGVAPPILLGHLDQHLDRASVADLSNEVRALDLRPDLVITHSPDDLNADHRITAEVALIAARPVGRPISVLTCEVPSEGLWNGRPFAPDYFVDITETLDAKIEAYACYEAELQSAPEPRSLEGIRRLAHHHGSQVGLAAAEAFSLVRGVAGQLP